MYFIFVVHSKNIVLVDERPRMEEVELKESPRNNKKGRSKAKELKLDGDKLTNQDHLNTVVITTAVTAVTTLRWIIFYSFSSAFSFV